MRFSPAWWAFWAGVWAVGLTAAAALTGIVAWYFSNVAAAESDARTGTLELRVAEQQERAAKAELALAELEKQRGPRWIDGPRLTAVLKGKSTGDIAAISVVTPDTTGEASTLALQLMAAFNNAGWKVPLRFLPASEIDRQTISLQYVSPELPTPLRFGAGRQSGILLIGHSIEPPATAYLSAKEALIAVGVTGMAATDPNLPDNTIRFVIGPKP